MKKVIIGRNPACDIRLNNSRVSGQHAAMWVDNNRKVWISDLQSTNGTFVDGSLVEDVTQLRNGSLVFLADQGFDWEPVASALLEDVVEKPSGQGLNTEVPQKRKLQVFKYAMPLVILSLVGAALFFFAEHNQKSKTSIAQSDDTLDNDHVNENDRQETTINSKDRRVDKTDKSSRRPRWSPRNIPIVYDYSCLDDESGIYQMTQIGVGIQDAVIGLSDREISLQDEMKVGAELKRDVLRQYRVWNNTSARSRSERIFNELVRTIAQPRGLSYELILIDAKEVNAFTAGGKVFLFRGMYEFVKSDDELASVLAHEIQHNERGHINRMLKKAAMAEDLFGEAGMIAVLADRILFASFGQKDESECDLHGVDHIVRLGYDGCSAAEIWKRFSKNEKEDEFEKLMRSHPYSKDRKACIVAHINTNYGHACRN